MISTLKYSVVVLILQCSFKHSAGYCVDYRSQVITHGLHFVPGPNACTLCICDNDKPKWCKSVLCSHPQNCNSFQMGESCCEFKCLDHILTNDGYTNTYDLAVRLIVSAVTAVFSLSVLFFLYHRLKKRKSRLGHQRQANEDQRSLNSIGYIAGNLGYHPSSYGYLGTGSNDLEYPYEEANNHFSLWKPPGNYFPRGEAPPPYEEAVRLAQIENEALQHCQANNTPSNPAQIPSENRSFAQQSAVTPQQNGSCALLTRNDNNERKEYVNLPVVVVKTGDSKHAERKRTERSDRSNVEKSKSYESILADRASASGSDKKQEPYINRNQIAESKLLRRNQNHEVAKKYLNTGKDMRHRTIPKSILSKTKSPAQRETYNLEELVKNLEIQSHSRDYHRTLPSTLKDINMSLNLCLDQINKESLNLKNDVRALKNESQALKSEAVFLKSEPLMLKAECHNLKSEFFSKKDVDAKAGKNWNHHGSKVVRDDLNLPSSSKTGSQMDEAGKMTTRPDTFFSYHCLSSVQDDDDDYRSECENCKFTGVTNIGEEDIRNETMTLHRRPLDEAEEMPYYRTSLTLPTNTKKPSRVLNTNNSGRESWFLAMDEYSSSDESS